MSLRAIQLAMLVLFLPVVGCGTVANLARQQAAEGAADPFGGVKLDQQWLEEAEQAQLGSRAHPKSESEPPPPRAPQWVYAADQVLSFVGDLVTWPYTVTYGVVNDPISVPPVTIRSSDELPIAGGALSAPTTAGPEMGVGFLGRLAGRFSSSSSALTQQLDPRRRSDAAARARSGRAIFLWAHPTPTRTPTPTRSRCTKWRSAATSGWAKPR